jgi:GntR family transcriptional regulator
VAALTQSIERNSPVPYYEQLFTILRDQISRGDIAPEERLPSELELCRDYGLSRATVRQTLSKLETEGYAHRVPRRGFFASTPGAASGWTVEEGFLESQIRSGRTGIETHVVAANLVAAPSHVAEALGIDPDTEVFALERLRSSDGKLAMFSTNWFPRDVEPVISGSTAVLDGTGSVDSTLRSAGHITSGAKRVIRAMRAPEQVAAYLRIDRDQPVLRVRSLSWDKAGRPFDYYETWVLTDVIPLEVSVSAS